MRGRSRSAIGRRAAGCGLVFLVGLVAIGGCTTPEQQARAARSAIVGLSQTDVRMCAGFPQRTSRESDGSEIWSYETLRAAGGVTVSAPILFGAANTSFSMQPGTASCKAQVRFVDGRAIQVVYAGRRSDALGENSVCAPLVDACVGYARASAPR